MVTSENGINFLVQEEGLRLRPYRDTKGKPTIGIGCTFYEDGRPVRMSDPPITKLRALSLFRYALRVREDSVNRYITSKINQNQFDALVSICYNIGSGAFYNSTLRRLVNRNPNDSNITEAFKMWRYSNGKPLLLNRRIREAKLYFKK